MKMIAKGKKPLNLTGHNGKYEWVKVIIQCSQFELSNWARFTPIVCKKAIDALKLTQNYTFRSHFVKIYRIFSDFLVNLALKLAKYSTTLWSWDSFQIFSFPD